MAAYPDIIEKLEEIADCIYDMQNKYDLDYNNAMNKIEDLISLLRREQQPSVVPYKWKLERLNV